MGDGEEASSGDSEEDIMKSVGDLIDRIGAVTVTEIVGVGGGITLVACGS